MFLKQIQRNRKYVARTLTTKPKVVLITGTTGARKSFFAAQLAKELNGEIISVDSVKVYKTLEVGSNKSVAKTNATKAGVPVHLVDICGITDEFSAPEWKRQAKAIVQDIISRGKLPILCGGAALYIEAFLGEKTAPPRNSEVAKEVTALIELDNSWEKSLARLMEVDPISAQKLNRNDYYRLVRALEIYYHTGRPKSSFQKEAQELDYDVRGFFVTTPRNTLYRSLDKRCEEMVDRGLLRETFLTFGNLERPAPVSLSIGYKETIEFIVKMLQKRREHLPIMAIDFMAYLTLFQAHSRQLARRQMSWFRNSKNGEHFLWLDSDPSTVVDKQFLDLLAYYTNLPPETYQKILHNTPKPETLESFKKADQVLYTPDNTIFSANVDGATAISRQISYLYSLDVNTNFEKVFPDHQRSITNEMKQKEAMKKMTTKTRRRPFNGPEPLCTE